MKFSTCAFHVVGLSTVMSASLFLCWIFYEISVKGRFIVYEDILLIRYSECVLVAFGLCYAVYLLVGYVQKISVRSLRPKTCNKFLICSTCKQFLEGVSCEKQECCV
jgi:hypothetical protein